MQALNYLVRDNVESFFIQWPFFRIDPGCIGYEPV